MRQPPRLPRNAERAEYVVEVRPLKAGHLPCQCRHVAVSDIAGKDRHLPQSSIIPRSPTSLPADLCRKLYEAYRVLDPSDEKAKLVLRIKAKPKEMQAEAYQRVMGKLVKPITDDDGIKLNMKGGVSFNGKEIAKMKSIKIETTSNGRLDEEQLKQEMERFLNELNAK